MMDTTVDAFPPPSAARAASAAAWAAVAASADGALDPASVDLSGVPLEDRLRLCARRHAELVDERRGIDYVHDALVAVVYARDRVSTRLAEHRKTSSELDAKLCVLLHPMLH